MRERTGVKGPQIVHISCGDLGTIATRIYGNQSLRGTIYLCISGIGGSATAWDTFAKTVCTVDKQATVIAYDHRCHGLSTRVLRPFTRDIFYTFGLDTAHIIEKLGIKSVVLIGHSFGGLIALSCIANKLVKNVSAVYCFSTPFSTTCLSPTLHNQCYEILKLLPTTGNDHRVPYSTALHLRYKDSWDFSPGRIYHDIQSVGVLQFVLLWLLILSAPQQSFENLPPETRYFCIHSDYDQVVSKRNSTALCRALPEVTERALLTNHNSIVNQASEAALYVAATRACDQARHES